MSTIHVAPDQVAVPISAHATLLDALRAAGIPITYACGGRARCSTCRVRVTAGLEHCSPRNEAESAIAEKLSLPPETRLACQTHTAGSVQVRRLVLDAFDARLASAGIAQGATVGRERSVVILFSDIADFTPFSEALPAYDVVHTLDRWFTLAGEVVQQHGGQIDNYMGDGFLALFDDAEVAVDAGLALLDAAAAVSRYTEAVYGLRFESRLGIHTGTVVVGTLGAEHNRRETVIGDVVNMTARIEAANKELGSHLLVSAEVERGLGVRFLRGRTVQLPLKGKSGVHQLVEVLPRSSTALAGQQTARKPT
jgi:adenylate cyclase